jgi:hypothetical protein
VDSPPASPTRDRRAAALSVGENQIRHGLFAEVHGIDGSSVGERPPEAIRQAIMLLE